MTEDCVCAKLCVCETMCMTKSSVPYIWMNMCREKWCTRETSSRWTHSRTVTYIYHIILSTGFQWGGIGLLEPSHRHVRPRRHYLKTEDYIVRRVKTQVRWPFWEVSGLVVRFHKWLCVLFKAIRCLRFCRPPGLAWPSPAWLPGRARAWVFTAIWAVSSQTVSCNIGRLSSWC